MNSSRETCQVLQRFVLHLELVMKLAESQQLGQSHTLALPPSAHSPTPPTPAALLEEGPAVLVACLLGFPAA